MMLRTLTLAESKDIPQAQGSLAEMHGDIDKKYILLLDHKLIVKKNQWLSVLEQKT